MVKHLLTVACAAVALSASAAEVVDFKIDYSKYDKFPYYVMGYEPTFSDGVMKASYPGEWYQFFAADGISLSSDYTYDVTIKVKSSKAGSITAALQWSWAEGDKIASNLNVTTDWTEQTLTFHNVGTATTGAVILQPGTFDGDLEFAYLEVSHEDTTLDPSLQCLTVNGIPADAANPWDVEVYYTFPTAVEAGTYTLKFDVYGVEAGKGTIWGTIDNGTKDGEAWYGGGEYEIAADEWTTVTKTYTFDQPFKMFRFEFGSQYVGPTLYLDNVSYCKEGSTENLIANGEFTDATIGNWSKPGWLKYDIFVGNGPAHSTSGISDIEAEETAEPVYYNMQGMRMAGDNLPAGIYVKVTGNKTEKVAVNR